MKKIHSIIELYDAIPENQMIIVDVLRQIVREALPEYCKEKLSYNVPYFYGKRGICIIWPAAIPRGGIKEGVLMGFWYGKLLKDKDSYLERGTNKQVFYKIFKDVEEIEPEPIIRLLKEAIELDVSR